MKNNPNFKILAREWLEKGDHDFDEAKLSFQHGGWTDIICFHCHQAVEKYLKGFLVSRGCDITAKKYKIHNLRILLKMCGELENSLKSLEADCGNLNQYYIEPRYPLGAPKVYPKREAKEALEAAEKIITFIVNLI
jgi:HEPN domain-containing protein